MKQQTAILLAAGALVLVVGGGSAVIMSNWRNAKNAEKYIPMLNAAESKYGIPRDLLARQAYQESRFRDDIVSGKVRSSAGAVGLMQIVPKWHPSISNGDINADTAAALDPQKAVEYAARIMRDWFKQYGSWKLALAAYNAGPGNVLKYGGVPPFRETQNYVSQIIGDLIDSSDLTSQARYA